MSRASGPRLSRPPSFVRLFCVARAGPYAPLLSGNEVRPTKQPRTSSMELRLRVDHTSYMAAHGRARVAVVQAGTLWPRGGRVKLDQCGLPRCILEQCAGNLLEVMLPDAVLQLPPLQAGECLARPRGKRHSLPVAACLLVAAAFALPYMLACTANPELIIVCHHAPPPRLQP